DTRPAAAALRFEPSRDVTARGWRRKRYPQTPISDLGRIPSALAHAPPSPERAPSRAITHKVRTPDRLQRRFTGGRLRLLATVTVWVLCTGDSRDEPNQRLDRLTTCSAPPPAPPGWRADLFCRCTPIQSPLTAAADSHLSVLGTPVKVGSF